MKSLSIGELKYGALHWHFCSTDSIECTLCHIRGGQKHKSLKFDGCPMNSHFIGLGLLRTVFGIAVACREGPVPAFSCIAGDIAGGILGVEQERNQVFVRRRDILLLSLGYR